MCFDPTSWRVVDRVRDSSVSLLVLLCASGTAVAAHPLPADVNGDGFLDETDAWIVRQSIGRSKDDLEADLRADLNGDGLVNVLDVAMLRQATLRESRRSMEPAPRAGKFYDQVSEQITVEPSLVFVPPGGQVSVLFLIRSNTVPLLGYSLDVEVTAEAGAVGSVTADVVSTNLFDQRNLIAAGGATLDPFFSGVFDSGDGGVFLNAITDNNSTVLAVDGVNDVLAEVFFNASKDALGEFAIQLGVASALSDGEAFPVAYEFTSGVVRVGSEPLLTEDDGLDGDYNRVGGFKIPPSAVAGGEETAIRVTLKRMYIDKNEDASQCPVRQGLPDLQAFEDQVRYLGPPAIFDNNSLTEPKWVGAKLQCTPHVRDWSSVALATDLGISEAEAGTIYYYGAEVVPCSIHDVQQATQSCLDSAAECFSDPLEIRTALWGAIWPPFDNISFTDIGKEVDAFKSVPFVPGDPNAKPDPIPASGAPNKWRAMLRDNEGAPGSAINFTDIGKVVDAFKSIPYAEDGPTACP